MITSFYCRSNCSCCTTSNYVHVQIRAVRTSVKEIDEYSVEQSKNPIKEAIQAFLPAVIGSIVAPIIAGKLGGSDE